MSLPWAEARGHFARLFERLAINVLKACDISCAAAFFRISRDEVWEIQEGDGKRGLTQKSKRPLNHIRGDGKAIIKGPQYMTLFCDLLEGTVRCMKTETLEAFYRTLSTEQKNEIRVASMDIWDPFFQATLRYLPETSGKIVFDHFHIMGHVGKAVDIVRKKEPRSGKALERKDSKCLWLHSKENMLGSQRGRFEALRSLNLMRAVTHLIKRSLANALTYTTHPVTNDVSEGLNSKIQTIKKRVYGFRNKERFKTAIYFHCGGLSLYPA